MVQRMAAWFKRHSSVEWDHFVRSRFRYRGEWNEIIRTADRMCRDYEQFGKFEGDCDDIATLQASVFKAAHEPNIEFHALRFGNNPEFSHVFVQCSGFVFDPVVAVGTEFPDVTEVLVIEV